MIEVARRIDLDYGRGKAAQALGGTSLEIVYYKDPQGNFGDDLNEYLWKAILPLDVLESPDLTLVGVGSILNRLRLDRFAGKSTTLVVLGSGTSYDLPPRALEGWHILAVRGPLTARLIDRPECSVTDSAILLAAAPGLLPIRSDSGRAVFMPHHRSSAIGNWSAAAKLAGVDYVSPHDDVPTVLEKLSRARIVITEAMHGAIVADTMRIPWLPAFSSPAIDEFKWRDWTESMDVPFKPESIPASSYREHLSHKGVREKFRSLLGPDWTLLKDVKDKRVLLDYLNRRFPPRPASPGARSSEAKAKRSGLKRRLKRGADPFFVARTAIALHRLARCEGYLSDDRIFANRLETMENAVATLVSLARRGEPGRVKL